MRQSAALLFLAVLCNGSDALARNPRDVFDQFGGIPQSVVAVAQTDPHGVDGLTLGSKVAYGIPAYREYQCAPSQKFEGFVWCTKTISDKEARGRFKAWFSILHAQDGTVAYVNRYQEPAYWSANEVADEIQRYSSKIGEEPHIIQLPARLGLPRGTLATWGKVVLEPIVGDELKFLGEDKPLKKGIAIDFIGNFTQSARQGLPIYRLAGGAGFVWAVSYNQSGRGTLRFSAVDASAYSPESLPPPAALPPVADPPGGAATAIHAQPTSPPGTTAPPPVDFLQTYANAKHFDAPEPTPPPATAPPPHGGEHLDCSAAPDCGAPTAALASVVASPRDPNDVVAQVLNYSTMQLQQTDSADGATRYAHESGPSNFRSRGWEQVMLDLVVTYWVWIISALIASGFLAGAWLRGARTRTQVAAARAAEDARRAAEVKAVEDAEVKAAEDVRRAAEAEAVEDARRAAEVKSAEDALRVVELEAAEEARRVAKARATKGARRVAKSKTVEEGRPVAEAKVSRRLGEAKAAEDARRAAEKKAAEAARAAEVKAAQEARHVAKKSATKGARRVAKARAVDEARSAAAAQPGKRPKGMAGSLPAS